MTDDPNRNPNGPIARRRDVGIMARLRDFVVRRDDPTNLEVYKADMEETAKVTLRPRQPRFAFLRSLLDKNSKK